MQIGVYTTDYVGNNTMEGYAYEVFRHGRLGSADQDNGMVLLMATGDDNYWATPRRRRAGKRVFRQCAERSAV